MGGLAVYKPEKISLGPVDFLNDVLEHTKLAAMDSYERTKQLAICFTAVAEAMKITNPITDFDKKEISELVLKRFKRLSINEVYYAFKLERFVEMGEPVKHYNRFDTQYVAQVLDKYVQWKISVRQKHNLDIAKKEQGQSLTEKEKRYWINKGVTECLEYFIDKRAIMDGKSYVYHILYDMGFLPTDVEYKKRVHKDAVEAIEFEYSQKEARSLYEKNHIKEVLSKIHTKGYEKVTVQCHIIALREFFQKLTKEENKKELEKFKKTFKND